MKRMDNKRENQSLKRENQKEMERAEFLLNDLCVSKNNYPLTIILIIV